MRTTPPRFAAALLRWVLPRAHRDLVLAELNEEYSRIICMERSWWVARLWYWRQAAGSAAVALTEQLRARFRGVGPTSGLWIDVRDARKGLKRSPVFAATVVATFALGIGTSSAVFSVLDAVVLRPLPYAEPDRLVRPWPDTTISKAVMETVFAVAAEPDSSFDGMAGYYETRQPIEANGESVDSMGSSVSPGYFDVLGVAPAHGRLFAAGDTSDRTEPDNTVIISDRLWHRQFGGRSNVIGESLNIGGQRRTVVGVLPASHRPLVRDVEFWLPMRIDRENFSDYSGTAQVLLLGRLAPGSSLEIAAAQIAATAQRVHDETPASYSEDWVLQARPSPLHTVLVRDVRLAVWMVMGAVTFLLLIACANVSNLLMVRAVSRRADAAVRVGLGATPWRIVRLRLMEGTWLGLAGGAVGALLALLLVRVIRSAGASTLALGDRIDANISFLVFTCVVTLVASLLSSAGPALSTARSQPHLLLKSGGRGSAAAGGSLRLNRAVVSVAVALAVVLVIGSTLMLRTVIHLGQVDPGFHAGGVTSMRVRFPDHGALSESAARTQFLDDALESLRAVPGTQSAAAVSFLPMATGTPSAAYRVKDVVYQDDVPPPYANFQLVVGDYHDAMGIPLRRGRWFDRTDSANSPVVGVINEALARVAFGDTNPLGRTITMFGDIEFQVIGVIGDTRQRQPSQPPAPEALFVYRQLPFWPGMFLTIRSDDRVPTVAELRRAVSDVQPSIAVSGIRPMTEVVAGASSEPRLFSRLLSAFGVLAVLLGGVGIYGLVNQDVSQRLPEFSIRIALGATRRQVFHSALAHSLVPTLIGVGAGALISTFATRGLSGLLFGISPIDGVTFVGVPLLLLVVALAASYVPARRAAAADPATVLH